MQHFNLNVWRRTRSITIAFALGAAVLLTHSIAQSDEALPLLEPDAQHSRSLKLINYFVERYHYQKTRLDDSLSSQILDRYLNALDNSRAYFTSSDIEAFESFRFSLDNSLLSNNANPFYEIFNVYQERVLDRLEFAISQLNQSFDFSINEDYQFDRDEAPWAIDTAELDELWRKRVKNDVLTLKLEGKSDDDIIDTLRDRYSQQERRTRQISSQDVFQTAINAYMTSIEPHTGFFSPRATENFKIRMSLSLEGIGAVLQMEDEFTVVQRVVPGGPAELEGNLKAGDRIVGVGQGSDDAIVDVVGWRLDDVVDLIRGAKGTIVRLQIRPDPKSGTPESKLLAITRDQIKLEEQAAQKSIIEIQDGDRRHRIGVIDIPTFYIDFDARARGDENFRSTTSDVRRLITELEGDQIDALIIDLRGNGGGALSEATALTGLFIESGPVVQVRDARGRTRINRDPENDLAYAGPLAVVVDRDSASASEIFAGAIQDYRRGIILGEDTFGKGTVQNLIDLDRYAEDSNVPLGQLKVTIAQFFRVSGASTQHRGVTPDIQIPSAQVINEYGERSLKNALPWDEIDPVEFASYPESIQESQLSTLRSLHEGRVNLDPDFTYMKGLRAIDQPLAVATKISLLEADREHSRDQRAADQEALMKMLEASHQMTHKISQDFLPRDIILIESARILADFTFGNFDGRIVVESGFESINSNNLTTAPVTPPATQ
ncbi:carboxy terminal-processing peptidase [Gammaproteobacteria bacterium]|nr:carboxy terminal-processing peptidase [Gammaproteobacteria bacterium]